MQQDKTISIAAVMRTPSAFVLYEESGNIRTIRKGDLPDAVIENVICAIEAKIRRNRVARCSVEDISFIGMVARMLPEKLKVFGVKAERMADLMRGRVAVRMTPDLAKALRLGHDISDDTRIVIASKRAAMHVPKDLLTNGLLSDAEAVDAFLAKMAEVSERRNHTAGELLSFLERGNCVALTKDGDILCYKALKRSDFVDKRLPRDLWNAARYHDIHTRSVPQDAGVVVCKDEADVDPDRARECSTGLHVGKIGYVAMFAPLNPVAAVRVDPRDVIAVPHKTDASKMRVCRYRILAIMPNEVVRPAINFYRANGNKHARLPSELRKNLVDFTMRVNDEMMRKDPIMVVKVISDHGPKNIEVELPARRPAEGDREAAIKAALAEILGGKISVAAAARKYDIPRTTLRRHLGRERNEAQKIA